jgi:hypothetical protein
MGEERIKRWISLSQVLASAENLGVYNLIVFH